MLSIETTAAIITTRPGSPALPAVAPPLPPLALLALSPLLLPLPVPAPLLQAGASKGGLKRRTGASGTGENCLPLPLPLPGGLFLSVGVF